MKFVLVLVLGLISSSVFAGNCHVQQVQAVVQHQAVQFVEVPHYAVQQQVILQPVRQRAVVQHVQQVQKVQQVVVKQQVVREKVVVQNQPQRVNVRVRVR